MSVATDKRWFLLTQWFMLTKVLEATICPNDRLSWEERAKNFTCDTENNIVYHCILDDKGKLAETCLHRITIPKRKVGCPGVVFINGEAHHENAHTTCPSENKNCPSGRSEYFSDQLYIYPICFLKESERSSYEETTKEACEKCVYLTEKTTLSQKDGSKSSTDTRWKVTVSLLTVVSIVSTVCLYILYTRYVKPKKRKKEGDAKYINTPLNGVNTT